MAKSKNFLSLTPPSIPNLTAPTGPATTPEAICEVLKARFFPPNPAADLSDIPSYAYPPGKQSPAAITVEEIASALSKAKSHKAPGPDGIPIFVLKLLGQPLLKYLQALFQACFDFSYHPSHFRFSSTVALRKPGNEDYSVPAAGRPLPSLAPLGRS